MPIIDVDDPFVVDELIEFMRDAGCVAVMRGATKVETAPGTRVDDESDRAEVMQLLEAWRSEHPNVHAHLVD